MSIQGDRIRRLRQTLKMTQTEFGANVGVKCGVVSQWEKGVSPIPYGRLLMICDAYRVNERWLRAGLGKMFASETSDKITSKDCAKDYVVSLLERAPEDLRQVAFEFCRDILKRFDAYYEDENELEEESRDEASPLSASRENRYVKKSVAARAKRAAKRDEKDRSRD